MCGVLMPPFVGVLVPLLLVYLYMLRRFAPLSRDIQRLESISRSPIFAQFSETLVGTATIRAYGYVDLSETFNLSETFRPWSLCCRTRSANLAVTLVLLLFSSFCDHRRLFFDTHRATDFFVSFFLSSAFIAM
jgi:hypothetical protein